MPLHKEWSIGHDSLAAIWKIDEPEQFFIDRTGFGADIKSEKRRMEHLAGRFLLTHLKHDFPLFNISPDEHDKPRVDSNYYYFSISHSWPYVAAVVSPYHECGIDIQCWHPRMEALQNKFLSTDEQKLFSNDPKLITLAWSAKEAAYKWQGRRGVEFIDHLVIHFLEKHDDFYNMDIFLNLMVPIKVLSLECTIHPDFSCALVTDSRNWELNINKTKTT